MTAPTPTWQSELAKATRDAGLAASHRNKVIRRAHSEGASIRQIAKATHLSATRIHQIIHEQLSPRRMKSEIDDA